MNLLGDARIALRALFFGWISVVRELLRRLHRLWYQHKEDREKLTRAQRRQSKYRCDPIKFEAYQQPDPLIYAQYYLLSQGLAVTWDNPDIEVRQSGQLVASHQLEPDTNYDVLARIWNNSTEAPAIGMPVRFSFLTFGIGTTSTLIDEAKVDLGVKGGSDNPAFAMAKWLTPREAGHYCLQVQLVWGDDANPANNLGQENVNVGVASSPAEFTFRLRNPDTKPHRYRFDIDTYELPEHVPCEEGNFRSREALEKRRALLLARHRREHHQLPVDWRVEISPDAVSLTPDQEIFINVAVTPADTFLGSKPVNINAYDERGNQAGGVTLRVVKQ